MVNISKHVRRVELACLVLMIPTLVGKSSGVIIDKSDCEALRSWEAYAQLMNKTDPALFGCTEDCSAYPGVDPLAYPATFKDDATPRCHDNGTIAALSLANKRKVVTGTIGTGSSPLHLAGQPPAQLGRLKHLRTLELWSNTLQGTLPPEWSNLTSLRYLNLVGANLSGTLPPEWSKLGSLQELLLMNTNVSGTLPASWSSMASLQKLIMTVNGLTGTLPAEWGGFASLRHLDLTHVGSLSGTLPPGWGRLSSLTYLALGNSRLSGTVPAAWAGMRSLRRLDLLDMPGLVGALPPEVGKFTVLYTMNVQGTMLDYTDAFAAAWCSNPAKLHELVDADGKYSIQCRAFLRLRRVAVAAILATSAVLLVGVVVTRYLRAGRDRNDSHGCIRDCITAKHMTTLLKVYGVASIVMDVVTDIMAVHQVFPRNKEDQWWPFVVLLLPVFIPNTIYAIAAWTSVSGHSGRGFWRKCASVAIMVVCLLPFMVSLGIALLLYAVRAAVSIWSHRWASGATTGPQPRGQSSPGCWVFLPSYLLQHMDYEKGSELLGLVMAVTEDPLELGVMSALYMINRRNIGQLLSTRTYLFAVVTSLNHMAKEAWTWADKVGGSEGWASLYKVFDLRYKVPTSPSKEAII